MGKWYLSYFYCLLDDKGIAYVTAITKHDAFDPIRTRSKASLERILDWQQKFNLDTHFKIFRDLFLVFFFFWLFKKGALYQTAHDYLKCC